MRAQTPTDDVFSELKLLNERESRQRYCSVQTLAKKLPSLERERRGGATSTSLA